MREKEFENDEWAIEDTINDIVEELKDKESMLFVRDKKLLHAWINLRRELKEEALKDIPTPSGKKLKPKRKH